MLPLHNTTSLDFNSNIELGNRGVRGHATLIPATAIFFSRSSHVKYNRVGQLRITIPSVCDEHSNWGQVEGRHCILTFFSHVWTGIRPHFSGPRRTWQSAWLTVGRPSSSHSSLIPLHANDFELKSHPKTGHSKQAVACMSSTVMLHQT